MASQDGKTKNAAQLDAGMQKLSNTVKMQGLGQHSRRASLKQTTVTAHNEGTSKFEANRLLLKRMVKGFKKDDGPVVCAARTDEDACICGCTDTDIDADGISWITNFYPPNGAGKPSFDHINVKASTPLSVIMEHSPSIAVFPVGYELPETISGYILVQMEQRGVQLLIKSM